jgi:hypothetical protein
MLGRTSLSYYKHITANESNQISFLPNTHTSAQYKTKILYWNNSMKNIKIKNYNITKSKRINSEFFLSSSAFILSSKITHVHLFCFIYLFLFIFCLESKFQNYYACTPLYETSTLTHNTKIKNSKKNT